MDIVRDYLHLIKNEFYAGGLKSAKINVLNGGGLSSYF